MGVETGGCPHTAIREDASINLEAVDRMMERYPEADIVFVESGGDNLAATFSPELSDLTIYVIDVAGGEKIPRKGGPASPRATCSSSTRPTCTARRRDLAVMEADTRRMRRDKPYVMSNLKTRVGVAEVVRFIETKGLLIAADSPGLPAQQRAGWHARLALTARREGDRCVTHAEHEGPAAGAEVALPGGPGRLSSGGGASAGGHRRGDDPLHRDGARRRQPPRADDARRHALLSQ